MLEKPKLVYKFEFRRSQFFRRFMWSLLASAAVVGAYIALGIAAQRGTGDTRAAGIGQIVAIALGVYFFMRGAYNLWLAVFRRSESLRVYDKGFIWTRGKDTHKYSWGDLNIYRQGAHGLYLRNRPVLQWGADRMVMSDGKVFKVTGAQGNTRQFDKASGRYIWKVTGMKIARALREDQPVSLRRNLVIYPGGVRAGKHEIHWSELDVEVKGSRLFVRKIQPNGKRKTIKRYNTHTMDNVGGFMELATSTIINHQPERFNTNVIRGPQYQQGAATAGRRQ